ncbi:MAG: ATP--guanido phosphotransferase [Phycisphaerales bacterium]|nr:ATP--guanido phosphotransferase [Phycisphaerales bacterium]
MSVPFTAALSRVGPDSDVVVTSRVRIARNISGFPFTNRASSAIRHEVLRVVRQAIERFAPRDPTESGPTALQWMDLLKTPARERILLKERHLASQAFVEADTPRALALSRDEHSSMMVNEEDHMRIQSLAPGAALSVAFDAAFAIEQALGAHVNYAFHPRWGFLTACPTNVGCGIRLSAMLHLPALSMTGEIARVKRAAEELHLAVRGYYGEGSASIGDFYQFSNQITLGATEEALRDEFLRTILPRIVGYEREARAAALARSRTMVEDRVLRAHAILSSARVLGADEATKLLGRLRFGVACEIIPLPLSTVQRLLLQVQPAHLGLVDPRAGEGEEAEREVRATIVRQALTAS